MPWTLWRSILIEFWRMMFVTTAVVVCAISFAVTVKPIADGSLSAAQALRFMGYAIPPMLSYALPFAACFSGTITYHRMVTDNEIIASHASGLSHKKILVPMLLSGLILGSTLVTLNMQIIPRFLQRMEEMVTRDFAKVLVNSLAQGRAAMIGSTEVHADNVQRVDPEAGSPIEQQFLLGGVVMAEAEPDGSVKIDGTARRAWIQLMPAWALPEADRVRIAQDDSTAIVMKFVDLTVNEQGDEVTWESVVSPAIPIPRVFKDDPKFMTSGEMGSLIENPDAMNFVDEKRVDLARAIAVHRVNTSLSATIARDEPLVLTRGLEGRVTIHAGSITRRDWVWSIFPKQGQERVEIVIEREPGRVDLLSAGVVRLDASARGEADPFSLDRASGGISLTLELEDLTIRSSTETQMQRTEYSGLGLIQDPLLDLLKRPSAQLLEDSALYTHQSAAYHDPVIQAAADRLEREIASLDREVLSKTHERWAFSATGLIIVVTGAVTAMRLKRAQALVIYLWSFFPALLAILLIAGGQQATHEHGHVGLALLYTGVLMIAAYTLNALRKVSRY